MASRLATLLGSIPLPAYFVLLITGFIFATIIGALWARRIGENPDIIIDLGIAMLIAGVAGSRILHVLADGYFMDYVHLCTDPSQVSWKISKAKCLHAGLKPVWDEAAQVCHPTQRDCFRWAEFYTGGLTYYGGFIAAAIVGPLLLKRDRFPFWKAADLAGFTTALGLCFGRMGCLLAGCCFGLQTSHPVGLIFPPNSPASEWQFRAGQLAHSHLPSLAVHPTQIYESAASWGICAFLMLYLMPRKRYDGQVLLAFVSLYAIARFVLEIWRSDDRGGMLGLSTSQLIGVGLLLGAYGLHRARKAGKFPLTFRGPQTQE